MMKFSPNVYRALIFSLLFFVAMLCSDMAAAQKRTRRTRKKNSEQITRIRVSVSLSDISDSLELYSDTCLQEVLSPLAGEIAETDSFVTNLLDSLIGGRLVQPRSYFGELVIKLAKEHLGSPYKWGSDGPDRFDCSGFTSYIFRQIGINLSRTSGEQFRDGPKVEVPTDLQPGDLVFFGSRRHWRNVGHVGIVTEVDSEHGTFRFIHSSTSCGVIISKSNEPYYLSRFIGGCRYIQEK